MTADGEWQSECGRCAVSLASALIETPLHAFSFALETGK
jgi:hypothetical protein